MLQLGLTTIEADELNSDMEWGGCLPLETHIQPLHQYHGFSVGSYNTGRSAMYAAVLAMGAKRVWLPYYLCPTVRDFLRQLSVEVIEYHIDDSFMPVLGGNRFTSRDAIVWTNWLGCVPCTQEKKVLERFGSRLILDNCHACFDEPQHGVYNVYAMRKVTGIPHGAFLVADSLPPENSNLPYEDLDDSDFPLTAYLYGPNAAYEAYLDYSDKIGSRFRRMHPLVRSAFSGLDWRGILDKRKRNLSILTERLGSKSIPPWFDLNAGNPIWFPLYVPGNTLIRKQLIDNRVWVPRLWKRILAMDDATEIEVSLTNWLLPLPIDQRYSEKDMLALANLVSEVLQSS